MNISFHIIQSTKVKQILLFLLMVLSCFIRAETYKGKMQFLNHSGDDSGYYVSIKLFEANKYYYYKNVRADSIKFDSMLTAFYDAYRKDAIVELECVNNDEIVSFKMILDSAIYIAPKKYLRRWEKPTRSGEGYNVGDSVIKGGDFVSLIDNNMWSPQEAPNYWKRKHTTFYYLNFKKPSGVHDCYNTGFKVLYNGDVYESLIDGNIWSPDEYRRGWKYIHRGPASMIDSSKLADHSFSETTTRSSAPNYTQPTGAHDAYKRGDLVSLDGITYRSIIDANVWSPAVARSYWEIVSGTRGTAEWKKPTGVHDCYHKGYKVTFNGKTYESLMSSNVWSPEELPSSWKVVE